MGGLVVILIEWASCSQWLALIGWIRIVLIITA
jgi:hypothetical protein